MRIGASRQDHWLNFAGSAALLTRGKRRSFDASPHLFRLTDETQQMDTINSSMTSPRAKRYGTFNPPRCAHAIIFIALQHTHRRLRRPATFRGAARGTESVCVSTFFHPLIMVQEPDTSVEILQTFELSPFVVDVFKHESDDCCLISIWDQSRDDSPHQLITLCSCHAMDLAKLLKKAARFARRSEV